MPNPCTAVDGNGSSLEVGDRVAIYAEIVGDAGGNGLVYLRLFDPTTSTASAPAAFTIRTGARQSDVIPVFDANLCVKL